jgi:hypothetical protein
MYKLKTKLKKKRLRRKRVVKCKCTINKGALFGRFHAYNSFDQQIVGK